MSRQGRTAFVREEPYALEELMAWLLQAISLGKRGDVQEILASVFDTMAPRDVVIENNRLLLQAMIDAGRLDYIDLFTIPLPPDIYRGIYEQLIDLGADEEVIHLLSQEGIVLSDIETVIEWSMERNNYTLVLRILQILDETGSLTEEVATRVMLVFFRLFMDSLALLGDTELDIEQLRTVSPTEYAVVQLVDGKVNWALFDQLNGRSSQ